MDGKLYPITGRKKNKTGTAIPALEKTTKLRYKNNRFSYEEVIAKTKMIIPTTNKMALIVNHEISMSNSLTPQKITKRCANKRVKDTNDQIIPNLILFKNPFLYSLAKKYKAMAGKKA